MRQLTLCKEWKRQAEFGGELLRGKRKSRRPFAKKKAMHITFRRSWHYGNVSLVRQRKRIEEVIGGMARKHRVRLYELSVNSNHLHLLLGCVLRCSFQNFLRECSIRVVRVMTGAMKGSKLRKRFWESRPWSRIVEWGRAFSVAKDYVFRNRLEADGVIPYNRRVKTTALLDLIRC